MVIGFTRNPHFLTYSRELHCQSSTGFCTPYNCVGPNLSLIDKKFKLGR